MSRDSLPPAFLSRLRDLEASYLKEVDPIRQSGFSGGAERWRAEREPIVDPIHADGEIIDMGCANGYLLECLVTWTGNRGLKLTPYGLDHSAKLIELARQRLPRYADHFYMEPLDLTERLTAVGHVPLGQTAVGEPPISRFAWLGA